MRGWIWRRSTQLSPHLATLLHDAPRLTGVGRSNRSCGNGKRAILCWPGPWDNSFFFVPEDDFCFKTDRL
ncbi:hypothetical protein FJTKL_05142 [Diaporthe vaccinii]|uniref:Secreted protein n=1 Tax=Diaporthe vaccinii TaxID=105482 RepID=A0ABR4FEN0_9PEZI